jgi:O-antigen/teichoic acid export membrane protein
MNHSNEIKRGAIISYFAIFFNIIAGLLYTPWMVRQIGVSDYGLYTLIGAFLSYFLMDFGLSQAIARFIAKYKAEGNQDGINNMLGVTTRVYLLIDIFIFVVLAIAYVFISDIFKELTPDEQGKFKIVFIIAGFFSIATFPLMPINGAMIAYERFVVLKLSDLAQKVLKISFMVVALWSGKGLFMLIFVNGCVGLIVKLYNFFYIKRKEKFTINIRFFDRGMAKELISFSVWIFVMGIAQSLILNIVPTILGILSGTREIAIFSIAMILEGYTYTFAQALNGLFLPKVTRMVTANDNRNEITDLMIRVGRLQFIVTGLLIAGIVVLGKPFIQLWMGDVFTKSYYVALFLIVPSIVILTQDIASTLLFVVNKIKYVAVLYMVAAGISLSIGIFLTPLYGAVGSAIGVGVALIACDVIGVNLVYSKILKLEIGRFFRSVHLKMLWPLVIAGVFSMAGQYFYPIHSWVSFVASAFTFVLLYALMMWSFVMNKEEKEIILSVINKVTK